MASLALLLPLLMSGCGRPVPPEKAAYVGEWRGTGRDLDIEQDGSVYYKRHDAGSSRSIELPLVRFEGDDFVVGFGPFSTTFVVAAPPHESDARWRMTVDGAELTRQPR